MELPLLQDVVVVFTFAVAALFICHRFRIPGIVGLLLTGVVVGPHGLRLIRGAHEVEVFAEIGVLLLLFTVGIDFSLERLVQARKSVVFGGLLQVGATTALTVLVLMQFGYEARIAVFAGFLVALSSTAIVIRQLQTRAEINTPYGGHTLSVLIFQDIIVVPMLLITPLLAGGPEDIWSPMALLAVKGAAIVVLVIVSARWVVPRVFYYIARTRVHEIFVLSVVVLCFGVAWLTSLAGLSLALGAFLAGLIISESEYSYQALSNILPFREVFTSFFFISIGMLLDTSFVLRHPLLVLAVVVAVMILKALLAGLSTLALGFSLRTSLLAGLALCQVGEFSFILSAVGVSHGLLAGDSHQLFLAVAVLTMAATPFIISAAPGWADRIYRLPLPQRLKTGTMPVAPDVAEALENHILVVGYGLTGQKVARAVDAAGISFAVVEMNPDTVRRERAKGMAIYYGDAVHGAVLRQAGAPRARAAVVAINDPTATKRITQAIRQCNPAAYIIVRTRYVQEMKDLYALGADAVIPEEFETSVEVFARLLARLMVPQDEITRLVSEARADGYRMFRGLQADGVPLSEMKLHLGGVEVRSVVIPPGCRLAGKTLAEAEFRQRFGVSVLAIVRNSEVTANPPAEALLTPGDQLYVLGSIADISEAAEAIGRS